MEMDCGWRIEALCDRWAESSDVFAFCLHFDIGFAKFSYGNVFYIMHTGRVRAIRVALGGCAAVVVLSCASSVAVASGGGGVCPAAPVPAEPFRENLAPLRCAFTDSAEWRRFYFEYSAHTPTRGASEKTATGQIEGEEVSAAVSGLLPNTEYSYNLVILNEAGDIAATGAQYTFTTDPIAPAVDGESAGSITASGATLEAKVNPNNLHTAYVFHYYAAGQSPGEAASLPEGSIAAGYGDHTVTAALTGLAPDTTYDYWATAFDAFGLAEGEVESFATPPASEPPASPGGGTGTGTPPGGGGGQTAGTVGEGTTNPGPSTVAPSGNLLLPLQEGLPTAPIIVHNVDLGTRTDQRRLATALKACRKKPHRQRSKCEKQAHIRYGLSATSAKKTGRQRRKR
jgi:hypothetical protein